MMDSGFGKQQRPAQTRNGKRTRTRRRSRSSSSKSSDCTDPHHDHHLQQQPHKRNLHIVTPQQQHHHKHKIPRTNGFRNNTNNSFQTFRTSSSGNSQFRNVLNVAAEESGDLLARYVTRADTERRERRRKFNTSSKAGTMPTGASAVAAGAAAAVAVQHHDQQQQNTTHTHEPPYHTNGSTNHTHSNVVPARQKAPLEEKGSPRAAASSVASAHHSSRRSLASGDEQDWFDRGLSAVSAICVPLADGAAAAAAEKTLSSRTDNGRSSSLNRKTERYQMRTSAGRAEPGSNEFVGAVSAAAAMGPMGLDGIARAEGAHSMPCFKVPPLDWSLKRKIRFVSDLSFAWCRKEARARDRASSVQRFVGTSGMPFVSSYTAATKKGDETSDNGNHLHDAAADEEKGKDGEEEEDTRTTTPYASERALWTRCRDFEEALLHWCHPAHHLDRDNPIITSVQNADAKSADAAAASRFLSQRWISWEQSLRSLHYRLRQRDISHYYVVSAEFTILFLAAPQELQGAAPALDDDTELCKGEQGGTGNGLRCPAGESCAIVSQATAGFRGRLKRTGVRVAVPFLPQSPILSDGHPNESIESRKQRSRKQHEPEGDLLGCQGRGGGGGTRASHASHRSALRVTSAPEATLSEGSLGSVAVIMGRNDVQGLFDVLLNWERRDIDVPMLISPSCFLNATLQSATVSYVGSTIRSTATAGAGAPRSLGLGANKARSGTVTEHVLEIEGTLMPSNVVKLLSLFKRAHVPRGERGSLRENKLKESKPGLQEKGAASLNTTASNVPLTEASEDGDDLSSPPRGGRFACRSWTVAGTANMNAFLVIPHLGAHTVADTGAGACTPLCHDTRVSELLHASLLQKRWTQPLKCINEVRCDGTSFFVSSIV